MSRGSVGRNDPCPCGSGRKYKVCCLKAERDEQRSAAAEQSAREHRNQALGHAIDWLDRRHPEDLSSELAEFRPADPENARSLSQEEIDFLLHHALEWTVAEGTMLGDGDEPRRIRDVVLGPGGPLLDAVQRRWLEALTATRMGLYRVLEVDPGVGLLLEDVLDEESDPVRVKEETLSRNVGGDEILGTRIVEWEGEHELGSVVGLDSTGVLTVLDLLSRTLGHASPRTDEDRAMVSEAIRDVWADRFTRAEGLPEMHDAGAGDALLLTTDHWDVLDWSLLAERLEAEPDVVGSRKTEGWVRLEDPEAAMSRSLLSVNVSSEADDRVESFARTRRLADEGREWFERVAGDSVRLRAC